MFRISVASLKDFEAIDYHEIYNNDVPVMREQLGALLNLPTCYSYSIFADDKPVGMLGLTIQWPGVADCWTLLGKEACASPVGLTRVTLSLIETNARALNLKRLSASSRIDNRRGHRWLELMGFQQEGTMRKYGPDGSDWVLFARVF